jgi:hypothetical protein
MEFKRLGEVTLVEETGDTANVLIEENGEIKRVPKTEVGGTGFPTAIIKDSGYDNTLAGLQTMVSAPEYTYECLNMTFEEAYEIMASGEILEVIGMLTSGVCINIRGVSMFAGVMIGVPCIILTFIIDLSNPMQLYWTADGISTSAPEQEK